MHTILEPKGGSIMIGKIFSINAHRHLHHQDNNINLNSEVDEEGHHCYKLHTHNKKGSSLPITALGDTLLIVH